MPTTIQLKRGTKSSLDYLALKRGLLVGEPFFITDLNVIAIADTVQTYNILGEAGPTGPAGPSGPTTIFYIISTSSAVITKSVSSYLEEGTHTSVIVQGKKIEGSGTQNFGWLTLTKNGDTESNTGIQSPVLLSPEGTSQAEYYDLKLYDNEDVTTANLLDSQRIYVVLKGASAVQIFLSNENHTFTSDSAGNVLDYTGGTTKIQVFEGSKELIYDGVGTVFGKWNISVTNNTNIDAGNIVYSGNNYIETSTPSSFIFTEQFASIEYTITGTSLNGTPFSFTKTQRFSKSKTGESALYYYLYTSSPVITKTSPDEVIEGEHSTINIQGRVTEGSITNNYGYITITKNGDTESSTAVDTSTSAYAFTPTNNASALFYTINLYDNSDVSQATKLDSKIINVIFEGEVYDLRIESTNGSMFKLNQNTSTTLIAKVFKNGVEVTDQIPNTWFKWTRTSIIPQPAPNDDATWNSTYSSGYKQITINVDSVYAKATFFCEIFRP